MMASHQHLKLELQKSSQYITEDIGIVLLTPFIITLVVDFRKLNSAAGVSS